MITQQEKRAIRRDIINEMLHAGFTSFEFISYWTRVKEIIWFKQELRIYYV